MIRSFGCQGQPGQYYGLIYGYVLDVTNDEQVKKVTRLGYASFRLMEFWLELAPKATILGIAYFLAEQETPSLQSFKSFDSPYPWKPFMRCGMSL